MDKVKWHRWFAWKPVTMENGNTTVWLAWVERRLTASFFDDYYEYRPASLHIPLK
jgi:hypothetical protein